MAKWRKEREHILNRFPSSMRDVFMWRTEAARAVYMYNDATASFSSMLLERTTRLFFSGVSNLKGLKRFPRGWSVGLSALERRSTDDNSFSPLCYYPRPSVRSRVDPFFTLSIVPVVTYCELLRGPLCRKKKRAVSFTPFVWADMFVCVCVFVCGHHRRGKFRLT